MAEKVNVIVANPAGNTTLFVMDPYPVSRYSEVANALLEIDFKAQYGEAFADKGIFTEDIYKNEIKGEQVAFVLDDTEDGLPAMNMCGLEFCGNASRSFAFLRAHLDGMEQGELKISVSGCDYPLTAEIVAPDKSAKIQMPLPKLAATYSAAQLGLADRYPDMADGILVNMDGIFHLVLKDVDASPEIFEELKALFYPGEGGLTNLPGEGVLTDFPAFVVMFLNTINEILTPVVYVHDVDTTYFEGSCASGTTATAFAAAIDLPDGLHQLAFRQPAGTLYAEIQKESGKITEIKLDGLVELSDMITVEI